MIKYLFRREAYEITQYWSMLQWKSDEYWMSNCYYSMGDM